MSSPAPVPSGEWPDFWEGLERGEVLFQECGACGRQQFPPSFHCRRCGAPDPVWRPVVGPAVVYAHTTVHRAPEEHFASEVPYVIAVADFAGGARMFGRLRGVEHHEVRVGMAVRAVVEEHETWRSAELAADLP